MSVPRRLIVNADDFGLCAGVNRGIARAHEEGIVTSASLMVRQPAAAEAVAYARRRPRLSVGLHFDLGESVFSGGAWRTTYQVVSLGDHGAVSAELERQLATFRHLLGRDPSHLDSHQHVHRGEPVRSAVLEMAARLRVAVRGCDPEIRFCGRFYGQTSKGAPWAQGISVEALVGILHELPAGCTELGCHPGEAPVTESGYAGERSLECETLCDPRVRAAILAERILLCGFPPPREPAPESVALRPDRNLGDRIRN